jgi:hypothetical protein
MYLKEQPGRPLMLGTAAMIPTEVRRRFIGSHTIGRRRGRKLILAVAGTAWLAAPAIAHAEKIDYVFSDASAVFNGTPETITGLATVDPVSRIEYYAKILLTGPAPYAGLYSFVADTVGFPLFASNLIFVQGLSIRFANDLSLSNNPLATVTINNGGPVVTDTAPTGEAQAVATPITYDLSNVSTTVFNGTPEPITGFFAYDPLTIIQYGAVFSTPSGLLLNDVGPGFPRVVISGTGPVIRLFLADDLLVTADPLVGVLLFPSLFPLDTAPTGEAVPVSGGPIATPEPATLALLGTTIGLFLLSPGAIRRSGRPHPNQPEGA